MADELQVLERIYNRIELELVSQRSHHAQTTWTNMSKRWVYPICDDPRWDVAGFHKRCKETNVAWIYIGYLRELLAQARPIPRLQEAAAGALHIGIPPDSVQLYVLSNV